MRYILVYIVVIASWEVSCVLYPSIPPHLLPCYRDQERMVWAPRRLDVLLTLLRRLENNSQLDLRVFSTSVLRSFRLDGIEQAQNAVQTEFVTPYRASGFQFHKYKILMEMFLPGQGSLDVNILSQDEQCALHKMLSSTVARWERGDENTVCPLSIEQRMTQTPNILNSTRSQSRCPIEEGVILTDWGTISPGTVTAAIAAALESQDVLMSEILNGNVFRSSLAEPLGDDTEMAFEIETLNTLQSQPQTDTASINNIWVATLAGDLAEVSVNQGPRVGSSSQRMTVGTNNRWNDTILPRDYYMFVEDQNTINWHITDAEILAGIDGLILAKYIPTWISLRATLSLSQVMYMYYSNAGVSFNPEVRACNRTELFKDVFNNDSEKLFNELSNFASLLSISQGSVVVLGNEWQKINRAAVDALMAYIPIILDRNKLACAADDNPSSMNLVVATDGAWTGYDVERFMSWLGGASALGWRGTSLSLIHGNSGSWLVPPARNLSAFFHTLHNTTVEWPNRLNFPNVMSTLIPHLQNVTIAESQDEVSVAPSTVVIIMSPGGRLSDTDLESARSQMNTLTQSYFDVYFAFVGRDLDGFRDVNHYLSRTEWFLEMSTTRVEEAIRLIRTQIIKSQIPKRIIGPHCPVNNTVYVQRSYEDFLLPYKKNDYRIHPFYLKEQPSIDVQFRGTSLGTIMVCQRRGENAENALSCREVAPHTYYWFNITSPCPSSDLCPPIYFSVTGISTLNLCANNDCRTPNEMSYYIEHTGLRCLSLRNVAINIRPYINIIYWIIFSMYIDLYYKIDEL